MFLTHAQWQDVLSAMPPIARATVVPLADVHRYAHHTMLVAELVANGAS
jgi:hypothetical protein